MGPGDPPGSARARFAARILGLEGFEGDPTPALLRRLVDDDYLPDPLAHEAILLLAPGGRPAPADSTLEMVAVGAEEAAVLDEVDRFAAGFFDIPVAPRLDRWRALARLGGRFPRILGRLDELRPGLMVERSAVDDPSPAVRALLVDLLDLHPLPPSRRAFELRERARRYLADDSLLPADRERALKQLRKRHPAIAGLSRGHLDRLVGPRRPGPVARARARLARLVPPESEPRFAAILLAALLLFGLAFGLQNSRPPAAPRAPRAIGPP